MSKIEDFDSFVSTLDSFKDLQSGISGSRIKKLTTYALEHVDREEDIVSSIIDYSRDCAASHKLGSLYIIDSIGRAYLDETRARNDHIKPKSKKGSYAHGVYTLGEAIQELLSNAIAESNDDHREKIRMLIDIWDRSGLFQKGSLNAVRAKWFSMGLPPSSATNSSAGAAASSMSSTAKSPEELCTEILGDVKSLDVRNIPQVKISKRLSSTEKSEQQTALMRLLATLQEEYKGIASRSSPSASENDAHDRQQQQPEGHRVTEYGSRRERERQHERYTSRRNRSRSPRRDSSHEQDRAFRGNHSSRNSNNDHHLYPDELNVPGTPHYRPKPVSYDPSLPPDTIKVFSRTLFIGGVPMNMKEWDLSRVLAPFADVQSVILNNHRKHAFVKVYSRREAENVLINFNKDGRLPLRIRWGVGFGPRDCCNYQHGYSVIPIHRLTDADKKWSLNAQWGGTGGQPLTSGIVFEEPDIVVGEGVSSKAISQKMPTDSGKNGPTSRDVRIGGLIYQNPSQPFGQMATPIPPQGYPMQQQPQQSNMYGQSTLSPPPQQQAQPQPQAQQGFDPTAQLNSLMNMLNQQPQQQ